MPHLLCCPCKLCGRQVVQRTVWTFFVVILPPSFDLSSRVTQTGEPVRVQAFIAQATVEALYVGILHRLAGLNEPQAHAPFFAPGSLRSTAKLRPVVHNDCFRQAALTGD